MRKGWISRDRVKKIFHRGLSESFEGFRDGYLPPLYLDNMIKLWEILTILIKMLET